MSKQLSVQILTVSHHHITIIVFLVCEVLFTFISACSLFFCIKFLLIHIHVKIRFYLNIFNKFLADNHLIRDMGVENDLAANVEQNEGM
jgi:hypothetical protein